MSIPETNSSATLDTSTNSATSQENTVDWEKRFKDTQAAYTRTRQENIELQAKLAAGSTPTISPEKREELEDLKFSDPDKWREELSKLEADAANEHAKKVAEATSKLTEKEQRALAYEDFVSNHPGFVLNDDIIANDVPRRITLKLEKGEISFNEYLSETHEFLSTAKVIANEKLDAKPNLNNIGGGSQTTAQATDDDIRQSYKNEIY
jgi:hypothetical protein